MDAFLSLLLLALFVALAAFIVIWLAQMTCTALKVPENISNIIRVIIIVAAVIYVLRRAWPLIGAFGV
jgi:hypothetical protein